MRNFATSGEITSGSEDVCDEKAYEYVGEFARGCAVGLKGVVGFLVHRSHFGGLFFNVNSVLRWIGKADIERSKEYKSCINHDLYSLK